VIRANTSFTGTLGGNTEQKLGQRGAGRAEDKGQDGTEQDSTGRDGTGQERIGQDRK